MDRLNGYAAPRVSLMARAEGAPTHEMEHENMADAFKSTLPAPEDKGAMTAENIAAALAGESRTRTRT